VLRRSLVGVRVGVFVFLSSVAGGGSACKSSVDAHPPVATASASAIAPLALPDQGALFARAARSLDPVDLAELASDFGGARLVRVVEEATGDPSARSVALAALPYAVDAELAYAPLVDRAKAAAGADAAAYLDAIAASLERPSKRGEWLAAEPIEAALPTLRTIALDATRTEEERALAATILHRLRDRGFRGAEEPTLD
jgi:hypothetical protein